MFDEVYITSDSFMLNDDTEEEQVEVPFRRTFTPDELEQATEGKEADPDQVMQWLQDDGKDSQASVTGSDDVGDQELDQEIPRDARNRPRFPRQLRNRTIQTVSFDSEVEYTKYSPKEPGLAKSRSRMVPITDPEDRKEMTLEDKWNLLKDKIPKLIQGALPRKARRRVMRVIGRTRVLKNHPIRPWSQSGKSKGLIPFCLTN